MSTTQQQQDEQQQGNSQQPQTPPATTDNASGDAQAQKQGGADEKRFTQAELETAIKDRLERERKKAKEDADKAAAEAEKRRLAEDQKFKELSEKQGADLVTLTTEKETLSTQVTTLQDQLKRYEGVFAKQLAEQKRALPEPVQKLLEKMPLLEQSTWIAENAGKLGIKGVPPTPKGNGGNGNSKDEEVARRTVEHTYNRNF